MLHLPPTECRAFFAWMPKLRQPARDGELRQLSLPDFILGPRRIALEENEIATAILIPESSAIGKSAFLKLGARKYLVISIVMAAARIEWSTEGYIERAALSVGACGPVAIRLREAEEFLVGRRLNRKTVGDLEDCLLVSSLKPISDIRASAGYRLKAAAELVRRTIAACRDAE